MASLGRFVGLKLCRRSASRFGSIPIGNPVINNFPEKSNRTSPEPFYSKEDHLLLMSAIPCKFVTFRAAERPVHSCHLSGGLQPHLLYYETSRGAALPSTGTGQFLLFPLPHSLSGPAESKGLADAHTVNNIRPVIATHTATQRSRVLKSA